MNSLLNMDIIMTNSVPCLRKNVLEYSTKRYQLKYDPIIKHHTTIYHDRICYQRHDVLFILFDSKFLNLNSHFCKEKVCKY